MVQLPLKSKQLGITAQALGKKTGKNQTRLWWIPASPRRAFSTATPLSSSCLCFSSTCSNCRWIICSERKPILTKPILLLCLQHTSSTKRLQSHLPFQKQVFVFNSTLLQQQASQILVTTSSPPCCILKLQTPWYSFICYNSYHLPEHWTARWCYSVSWAPALSFWLKDDVNNFPADSLVITS